MQSLEQLDFLAVLEQHTQQGVVEFTFREDRIAVRNGNHADASSREHYTCPHRMDNLGMLAESSVNKTGGGEPT